MALIGAPVFFKQTLLDATKTTINKQVNAEVEFSDFSLTVLKSFPKVTLELKNVVITGKGVFKDDTLLNAKFVRSKMSLSSVFNKTNRSVEEIVLVKPELNLAVNEKGKANWDIAKEKTINTETVQKSSNSKSSANGFELQLEKVNLKNAKLVYDDAELNMLMELKDINADVFGKMYGSSTELNVKGLVDNFLLNYDGINYIANTKLEIKSLLDINYETMDISILGSELLVNRLPLEISGLIQAPSDTLNFDVSVKSSESGFENFLALVPQEYEKYLNEIKTSGSAAIFGNIKGLYFGENYPAFSLSMEVINGNFRYAELTEEIKNITADVLISKPQGILDLTEIKVKEAHAEVKNNPVDLTLLVNHLISDPQFDGTFIGKINLNHLKDALPLDSVNISGIIDANLFVKVNYSAIENKEYDKIKSDGIILLDNFLYDSPNYTQQIFVSKGQLNFTPKNINLQEFNIRVGQSDFNLTGQISDYLNYALNNGILKGNLNLNSSAVNLNELLRLQAKEEEQTETVAEQNSDKSVETTSSDTEVIAFTVPENIDITFHSNIKNAILDRIPISNINGLITAQKGKLVLNDLSMKMLDGELKMNGSYENTTQNQPLFDFGFDILSFNIPQMYKTISGIQKMMPVAGRSYGDFSTSFKMNGRLNPDFKLIAPSINGLGMFSTQNLRIVDSPIFNQIKGILKEEKLKNITIDDFKANFNVSDGNLLLKPFKTKIAGQKTTIYGNLSAQNLIDMRLDFNIEREAFGDDIQSILNVIPGNKNISIVPASVVIKGPVGEAEVKMDLSETRKTITEATKDDLQNSLNKLRNLFK